jgi:uncharacterized Fe-S cluster-containing MiaB family protein
VEWALNNGADKVVLFPLHVKRSTLLAVLHEKGLYRLPSLWSLIEVLSRMSPSLVRRTTISWYRHDYGSGGDVLKSPTTCRRCERRVLALLDAFRDHPCVSTVSNLTSLDCQCKEAWTRELSEPADAPIVDRVLCHYESLARDFGLLDWWATHADEMRLVALTRAPCHP